MKQNLFFKTLLTHIIKEKILLQQIDKAILIYLLVNKQPSLEKDQAVIMARNNLSRIMFKIKINHL